MGERYLITGTQLGMLEALDSSIERHKLVEEIIENQFVGNSENNITIDVKRLYIK